MIELTVRKREKRGWKIKEKVEKKGERKREREHFPNRAYQQSVSSQLIGSVSLYKPFQIHAICS